MSLTKEQEAKSKALRDGAQKLLAGDYFTALGISKSASPDEVKKAFIEVVKTWHPDRVPGGLDDLRPLFSKVFARLELARATVSDPQRRQKYIEDLAKPQTAASATDISGAEATLEFKKADALIKKNDLVQAEAHLRRAVQLAPSNVEYHALLAWLQAKPDSSLERLRELVTELTRLIGLDGESEKAYFYRGMLRKRLDLTKEAMSDFARVVEINPKNVDATREVRLYAMRKEKAAGAAPPEKEEGFFKRLFKR